MICPVNIHIVTQNVPENMKKWIYQSYYVTGWQIADELVEHFNSRSVPESNIFFTCNSVFNVRELEKSLRVLRFNDYDTVLQKANKQMNQGYFDRIQIAKENGQKIEDIKT